MASRKPSSMGMLGRLPSEVRNSIYELVVLFDEDIEPHQAPARQPAMTMVCKGIRKECLPMYYGGNTFLLQYQHHSLAWLKHTGHKECGLLRHVKLESSLAGAADELSMGIAISGLPRVALVPEDGDKILDECLNVAYRMRTLWETDPAAMQAFGEQAKLHHLEALRTTIRLHLDNLEFHKHAQAEALRTKLEIAAALKACASSKAVAEKRNASRALNQASNLLQYALAPPTYDKMLAYFQFSLAQKRVVRAKITHEHSEEANRLQEAITRNVIARTLHGRQKKKCFLACKAAISAFDTYLQITKPGDGEGKEWTEKLLSARGKPLVPK